MAGSSRQYDDTPRPNVRRRVSSPSPSVLSPRARWRRARRASGGWTAVRCRRGGASWLSPPPGLDGPAAGEDGDHLPQLGPGGGDGTTAQRCPRRQRSWPPSGLVQDLGPALGEFPAGCGRDDPAGADGQGTASSRRVPGRDLAVQGGSQHAGHEAIPRPFVVWRCVVRAAPPVHAVASRAASPPRRGLTEP